MTNDEYTPEVELDDNDSTTEEVEDISTDSNQEEESNDDTDWKAEALKFKAILDRNKNKKAEKKTSQKGELDYGEKAYLVANGIKGGDEMKLVKDIMSNTGKSLDDVLESKYFKAELEELREVKKTTEATPNSSNRSSNSSQNSVEYWLAKGELPPASEVKLRRDVVNARLKKNTSTGQFYNS